MPLNHLVQYQQLQDPGFMRSLYEIAIMSHCYTDEEYLAHNPDVTKSGLTPFMHCCLKSDRENRYVSPYFDPAWYKKRYFPHTKDCCPTAHFFTYGVKFGLKGNDNAYSAECLLKWREKYFSNMEPACFTDWPWKGKEISPEAITQDSRHIVLVLHESTRTGAPLSLLHAMQEIARKDDVVLWTLFMRNGPLDEEFMRISRTLSWIDLFMAVKLPHFGIMHLANGFACLPGKSRCIIANSVAVPKYVSTLFTLSGIPSLPWIHELPEQLKLYSETKDFVQLCHESNAVMVPSNYCSTALNAFMKEDAGSNLPSTALIPLGGAIRFQPEHFSATESRAFKAALGLPEYCPVVLGCGAVGRLKGVDLFVEVAILTAKIRPDVSFVWVGKCFDEELVAESKKKALAAGVRIIFTGEVASVWPYYAASAAFLFTSRSDSLGLVVAEAKSAGLASLCFEGWSGITEYLDCSPNQDALIAAGDVQAMADALLQRLPSFGLEPVPPIPLVETPFSAKNVADRLWNTLVGYAGFE